MKYRTFPRTGWKWAEVGYGTWGMAGWSGSNDDGSLDISDGVRMLHALFCGQGEIPVPFRNAGNDPTPDALGCP